MNKWEEKKKQKIHDYKIENAKSSIRRFSNSRQRPPNSSRVKNAYHTKQSSAPIHKILEIFKLEKYGPLLASYGFPAKLTEKKSLVYLDQMMEEVAEKDKQKFLSLLNTLTIMSKDVEKVPRTPHSITNKNKVHYPPPPSSSINSRQPPGSVQKSEKGPVKFRVKEKNSIGSLVKNNAQKMNQNSQQYDSRKSTQTRQNSTSTDKRRKKSLTHRARDDLSLVHDFSINANNSGILRPVNQSNKIVQKLTEKLGQIIPKIQSKQQINLQFEKIKNMYLSFDSATLTSNIINIDLHEMIECLAIEIKQMIVQGQVNNLAKSNADKIKSLLHQSFVLLKEEDRQTNNNISKQEPSDCFKSSLQNMQLEDNQPVFQIQKFQHMRQIDVYDSENRNVSGLNICQTESSQAEEISENCSIDMNRNLKQSSIWGNSYIASVINDFSCFDSMKESVLVEQPKFEDIKNFIDLVVMAGRMQKQVTIIAYIYLKRLLNATTTKDAKITEKNWRNLIFISLIEASKIWDDQSLENHSFAKLIKPYTTLQINRLEKYLLYFLDYRLTIEQKEYSQAYFRLRKHRSQKQSTKSSNLIRLDIRTIQKLQQTHTSISKNSKTACETKEYFKRLLNKSF